MSKIWLLRGSIPFKTTLNRLLVTAYFNNSEMVSSYDFKIIINNLKQGNHFTVNSARSSNSYAMTDTSHYGLSHLIDMCYPQIFRVS